MPLGFWTDSLRDVPGEQRLRNSQGPRLRRAPTASGHALNIHFLCGGYKGNVFYVSLLVELGVTTVYPKRGACRVCEDLKDQT